jgi:hypothetical protein
MPGNKLYFFSGRRTPVVAASAKAARAKKRRGGDKIVSIRTPTPAQRKAIAAGRWVGTPKDRQHLRGHGPKPKRR